MSAQLDQGPAPQTPKRRGRLRRTLTVLAGLLVAYLLVAYVALPLGWVRYAHRYP